MNRLTDMNSGWWPFLHLRPSQNQDIGNRNLLRMSLHFGPLYGLILALILILVKPGGFSFLTILVSIAATTVYFFVAYKFTFAVFWNRRARRLREQQSATTIAT